MKRIVIILFCLFLQFGSLADIDSTRVKPQDEMIKKSELTPTIQILDARVDMLEKHESWTLGMLTIFIAALTVLFFLLQWLYSKKAEENVYNRLAKIANKDKEAFKEAIKMKSVELELMSDYPIYIIYDMKQEKQNSLDLYKLIISYHFINTYKPISYDQAMNDTFCQKSILVFCEDSYSHDSCQKLLNQNPDVGVFGFGQRNEANFSLPKHKCLNYANSLSSVYNNLMSLLHYKRYLNSLK